MTKKLSNSRKRTGRKKSYRKNNRKNYKRSNYKRKTKIKYTKRSTQLKSNQLGGGYVLPTAAVIAVALAVLALLNHRGLSEAGPAPGDEPPAAPPAYEAELARASRPDQPIFYENTKTHTRRVRKWEEADSSSESEEETDSEEEEEKKKEEEDEAKDDEPSLPFPSVDDLEAAAAAARVKPEMLAEGDYTGYFVPGWPQWRIVPSRSEPGEWRYMFLPLKHRQKDHPGSPRSRWTIRGH